MNSFAGFFVSFDDHHMLGGIMQPSEKKRGGPRERVRRLVNLTGTEGSETGERVCVCGHVLIPLDDPVRTGSFRLNSRIDFFLRTQRRS